MLGYEHMTPVMYSDSTGNAPEWLKWLSIGAAVLGTILVVGAITVLTMGVGTTIMATTMAGAVLHGAAVGTLIGAGIGVVAGGIIGGAVSDWSTEGILIGMGIGFGGGALIGAIAGGATGAIQYSSAANSWYGGSKSMVSHFKNHGVKMGYKNPMQYTNGAKSVINGGRYISQSNAYATSISGLKYSYVGVNQGGQLITTFFTKTLTMAKAIALGLL